MSRTAIPCVVDLDGTLIHSDLLVESFLLLIGRNPLYVFLAVCLKGRAALKTHIAQRVKLNAAALHYNLELLSRLKAERQTGRPLCVERRSGNCADQTRRLTHRAITTQDFVAYHARGARMEGPVSSIALGWFQLWPLAEVESRNEQYHVAEFAPELLAFGSDGGGEMLAFDAKDQIVSVPFIGMEMQYAQIIAPTWRDFERILSI